MLSLVKIFGFCHSPVDIRASARVGVSGSERGQAQTGADRRGSELENRQENDKNQIFFRLFSLSHVMHIHFDPIVKNDVCSAAASHFDFLYLPLLPGLNVLLTC